MAIPTIAGNLAPSLAGHGYHLFRVVANAISIPLTGLAGETFGEVKLFMWPTVAFAAAASPRACGVSSSLNMLIFFRVVQGVVAGSAIPLSQKPVAE